jgi:5-methylcytosine-specific restriction protein A
VLTANAVLLDLGRSVRTFTPEQARALQVMYPTCVMPGCTVPSSKCEMHHLHPWEHGGPTDLANGAPVCWHGHHMVHEYGWTITKDPTTGRIDIYQPDGTHAGTTHPRRRPDPIPIRTRAVRVPG